MADTVAFKLVDTKTQWNVGLASQHEIQELDALWPQGGENQELFATDRTTRSYLHVEQPVRSSSFDRSSTALSSEAAEAVAQLQHGSEASGVERITLQRGTDGAIDLARIGMRGGGDDVIVKAGQHLPEGAQGVLDSARAVLRLLPMR
jgi:hypothetical protein